MQVTSQPFESMYVMQQLDLGAGLEGPHLEAQEGSGTACELMMSPLRNRLRALQRAEARLPADREWLEEIAPRPGRWLGQLEKAGLLVRAAPGAYALASEERPGTLDGWADGPLARLAAGGQAAPFMLSHACALADHGLISLPEGGPVIVSVLGGSVRSQERAVHGREVRVIRFTALQKWFGAESASGPLGSYPRSTAERALADCADRPDDCGGLAAWADVWRSAAKSRDADLKAMAAMTAAHGYSAARRAGWMLEQIGEPRLAARLRGRIGVSGPVRLIPGAGLGTPGQWSRDSDWGLLLNAPASALP